MVYLMKNYRKCYKMSNYHRYTKENKDWLRDNIKGTSYKELTKQFNDKFESDVSIYSIRVICSKNKLRNGNNTRFKKDDKPFNFMNVGTVTKEDGYYKFKKNDKEWVYMHRFIYEFFKGKVPDGYEVVFIDGDRSNLSIDNLVALHVGTERNQFVQHKYKMKDYDHNVSLLNLLRLEKALEEVENE